jgi:hypothetical protein
MKPFHLDDDLWWKTLSRGNAKPFAVTPPRPSVMPSTKPGVAAATFQGGDQGCRFLCRQFAVDTHQRRASIYRSLTVRAHLPCGRMNRRTRMDDSTSEWLTYEQAAERLHVSPAAVRARAMRGGWRRQPGNDANQGC